MTRGREWGGFFWQTQLKNKCNCCCFYVCCFRLSLCLQQKKKTAPPSSSLCVPTASLPGCWLTRRDELLHARVCSGGLSRVPGSHKTFPQLGLEDRQSGGGWRIQGTEKTAAVSHTVPFKTGNCCNSKRATVALPFFSICSVLTLTRHHVHMEIKGSGEGV